MCGVFTFEVVARNDRWRKRMNSDSDWKRKALDRDWERYRENLDNLSKEVAALNYDGMTAHLNKLPRYGPFVPVDRYLLPCDSVWLTITKLLEPLPIPQLPEVPVPPALHLAKNQYASWYLEPRKDGKLSFFDSDLERRSSTLAKKEALERSIDDKRRAFEDTFNVEASRLNELRDNYLQEQPEVLATLIEISDRRHPIPYLYHHLPRNMFRAFVDPNAKVVLIELWFPDFAGHKFQVGATGGVLKPKPKYASEAQKKKIVRQCLYSLVIRAGYLASRVLEPTSYKTIAINVSQDWFDPATGAPRTGIICSLQAQVSEFTALQLDRVDPEACFRHLKGIAVPSFDSISPVRPIFVMNKNDDRFIAAKDLDSVLAPEANLAAMPWEDFEQLVAQLFEWEFAKEGVEVKVTRASRDRGVDAVLFDPDPLRGGKFVLQAKRYTKPVDVAAVRDLYGTLVNEGANRGILITTSSYGPDSYAFAKDKPISLVDGPNLLEILRRHGKKYRIDLDEARRLYQEG
jgi:restriction system protein